MTLKKRARGHGYVVVYQVLETEVYVFYYFHTAQDWMTQLRAMLPEEGISLPDSRFHADDEICEVFLSLNSGKDPKNSCPAPANHARP